MLFYIIFTKRSFKAMKYKHIFARSITNCISIMLFSLGFQYTTVTNANMLQMTYPIFVMILAPIIYREKINKSSYLYLVIIMIGCYLVTFPKFDNINLGDIMSLSSALSAAVSVLFLKEVSKCNEGYTIVFYVMLIATLFNVPFIINDIYVPNNEIALNLLLSAFTGFLGQTFITMGYKYVDNATGAMVSTSRIIIAAVLGIIIFSDPLNIRVVFGGILIIMCLIGISGYFQKYANKNYRGTGQ